MNSNRTDQIMQVLFPETRKNTHSVWMVLDGARDERIYPYLRNCKLDNVCLYSGNIPLELQYVAPYLIEIPPNSKITRELIALAWGNSWGIFLTIQEISNLRPHLRKFLKVKDESGMKLIFRYYDPRVLRIFLPTCTIEQLRTFFGPVSQFYVENDDKGIKEFAFDGLRYSEKLILIGDECLNT